MSTHVVVDISIQGRLSDFKVTWADAYEEVEQGVNRYRFTLDDSSDDASFDVRTLDVSSQPKLKLHPPFLAADCNPLFSSASAEQKAQWKRQWAEWHEVGGGEEMAIRAIICEAIDRHIISVQASDLSDETETLLDRIVAVLQLEHGVSVEVARAAALRIIECPDSFSYERWRHGGWYVSNVKHAAGGIGCVSSNYDDKKWRIVCGSQHDVTFRTRDEAARAEHALALEGWKQKVLGADQKG